MATVDALADELARFAAAVRAAGDTGLRKEPHLPDRYAEVLNADLRIEISVRTGATDPGVTIIASPVAKQRKLRIIDSGNLRHPVFADRTAPRRTWRWRDQELPSVKPGWFTEPCEAAAPAVRKEIAAGLDRLQADVWAATHG